MLILGIDPGNARCGYGVIRKDGASVAYITAGCIETPKTMLEAERLLMINRALQDVIKKFAPDEAALEDLFYFKNQKTIIAVAQARGVILRCCASRHLPIFSYTPLQIKQAVTSYGRAEKTQVLAMVMRILKLKVPPKPDDAADALAVALCHAAVPAVFKKPSR